MLNLDDFGAAMDRVGRALVHLETLIGQLGGLAHWDAPDPGVRTVPVLAGTLTETAQGQLAIAEHVANTHATLADAHQELATAHDAVRALVDQAATDQISAEEQAATDQAAKDQAATDTAKQE